MGAGWNGISFVYNNEVETSTALEFYTDAAPSVGFGGYHSQELFCAACHALDIIEAQKVMST